jgi:hypothetical protein
MLEQLHFQLVSLHVQYDVNVFFQQAFIVTGFKMFLWELRQRFRNKKRKDGNSSFVR